MKFFKKEMWPLLLILVAACISVKALAIPQFYTSHDGETHTARLANYFLALREGQLPPQLAPTLFGGFGFPIFVFIYPLPYLVGSMIHFFGFSYTDSAELTMALGQIVSALAIYLFFKLETKKTIPSVLGALFFTYAPYRFLMLFVRGAFAESFAYIFIATSLICINRLAVYRNPKWVGLTALSISGLLLSHQLVSVMFLPIIGVYALVKLFSQKHKLQFVLLGLLGAFIGLGIAAFIYLPSYFEREYLRFDDLISYTEEHFVTMKQLIRSPWSYGFSHKGVEQDDMSFQIGLTHLVVVFFSIIVVVWGLLGHKKKITQDTNWWWLVIWLGVFGVATAIMIEHPLNHWIWKHAPILSFVDFPWRFIGVSVVAASFLVVYLLIRLNNNLVLLAFVTIFVFYANRNHLRINQSVSFSDSHFDNYASTATWQNEFLTKHRLTNKWENVEGDYQLLEGDAAITQLKNTTQEIELSIDAQEKFHLLIHRLYFPGWRVKVNDRLLDLGGEELAIQDASLNLKTEADLSGFMIIRLQPGEYHLEAKFTPTPLRAAGQLISLLSLTLAGVLASYSSFRKKFIGKS